MTAEIKVLTFAEGTPVSPPDSEVPADFISQKFRTLEQIDSTTTGSNATSVANTSSIMKFTNAGLVSLTEIAGADINQLLIIINGTGNDVEIINGSDISTDTGANLTWENGTALFMAYIESLAIWKIIGGSSGGGSSYKKYTLTNNAGTTNITGLILSSSVFTSASYDFEIERIGSSTFRQIIQAQAIWSGTAWSLTFGNYSGSDIIQDSITSTEQVVLTIHSTTGQIRYSSGNLAGHTKTTLKVFQNRMKA